jgi:demethylmenaquinone methyltransferase/2-methoxy-6-polyprenyl-1,4-benzoquinol methylase
VTTDTDPSNRNNEPHPILPAYYADSSQRPAFVRGLFNRTAPFYDRINRLFSLGTGDWYRRHALLRAGLRPGMQVLDVAVGTGLTARQAVRIVGDAGGVIGLDVSEAMLAEARRTLHIPLIQGRAEQLPLTDASLDFLCMGYALRHVADLSATFREFRRVLRSGGKVLLLEIGKPRAGLPQAVAELYLGRVVPFLSRCITLDRETETLMRYYWDTIENCVPPDIILSAMREAGLADAACDEEFGIFRSYTGSAAISSKARWSVTE